MAFNPNQLIRWTPIVPSDASSYSVPVQITPTPTLPQFWGYQAGTDTLATVSAAGYFNYFANSTQGPLYNNGNYLQKGDLIYCACSDSNGYLQVATIGTTITTIAPPADIAAGTITTAMLGANIVTAAKIASATITTTQISATAGIALTQLAALPSGEIIVGSAGTVPTAVAMSGDVAIIASGATTIQAGVVTSGKIDPQVRQFATVALTAAQFNAMYTTPVQIIAAPAAGHVIFVDKFMLSQTFGTAAYTAGGAIALQYGNSAHGAGVAATGTIAAASITGMGASQQVGTYGNMAAGANAASAVYISNATQLFATGDGTWNVEVWYTVNTL